MSPSRVRSLPQCMNAICFCENLAELGLDTDFARQVLDSLGETFTLDQSPVGGR